ncbi:MAG: hypothetical protein II285_04675 [Flavobacteriales bacterium]|nr:hypothetical protein [Flavobacteriales bacterium]
MRKYSLRSSLYAYNTHSFLHLSCTTLNIKGEINNATMCHLKNGNVSA